MTSLIEVEADSRPRIAWLLTSAFYYWHPMLNCVTHLFPQTVVFAANWRGYAPGFEDSFNVDVVGERKVIALTQSETSYGSNFTYMPLNIVNRLFNFRPNVIFSNSFGIWTLLALLFKPLGGWKVIIAYEGSSPGVDYRNSLVRRMLRKAMVAVADACITNSQAGKDYLIDFLSTNPSKVFLHPYEVPSVDTWLQEENEPIQDKTLFQSRPVFLFVGSITPRKGMHLLLKACAYLKQNGHDKYTLIVVGDGPKRQELELFCQDAQLTDCVKWIGQVEYKNLGPYFQQADIFVLPTLEDTWGMVVLEAMAVGKGIFCSQFAGASELIKNGENGYTFDPHETAQLALFMQTIIDNVHLSADMGQKSKQLMALYTPELAAKFLEKVTNFVLDES